MRPEESFIGQPVRSLQTMLRVIAENDFLLNETLPYINKATDDMDRDHYEETNSTGPETGRILLEATEKLIK